MCKILERAVETTSAGHRHEEASAAVNDSQPSYHKAVIKNYIGVRFELSLTSQSDIYFCDLHSEPPDDGCVYAGNDRVKLGILIIYTVIFLLPIQFEKKTFFLPE